MDCPRCQKPLPASFASFTRIEQVTRGKNEICPNCQHIMWIPFEGPPSVVALVVEQYLPAMIATRLRRASFALRLPH